MDARSILLLKRIFFVWALLVIPLRSQNASYSESELEAMLDEELEGICLERGFELVKEDKDFTPTATDLLTLLRAPLCVVKDTNDVSRRSATVDIENEQVSIQPGAEVAYEHCCVALQVHDTLEANFQSEARAIQCSKQEVHTAT